MGATDRPSPRASRCGSCGAAVFWAVNGSTNVRGIFDYEPRSDGNVVVVRIGDDGVPVVRYLKKHEVGVAGALFDVRDRYVSHFASCPNAAAHRKTPT